MEATPKYLTEKQVSEMVGISISTLRFYRSQRLGIPFSKIQGRMVRYNLADVISFMEASKIDTTMATTQDQA